MGSTMMHAKTRSGAGHPAATRLGGSRVANRKAFLGIAIVHAGRVPAPSRAVTIRVQAVRDGEKLDRKLRVAVIGGGPSGACAADDLAKGGVETFMFERKMDNCKVRGWGLC
jgi:threonine dehydrogenase-like Zn-dependent dehydrogenase